MQNNVKIAYLGPASAGKSTYAYLYHLLKQRRKGIYKHLDIHMTPNLTKVLEYALDKKQCEIGKQTRSLTEDTTSEFLKKSFRHTDASIIASRIPKTLTERENNQITFSPEDARARDEEITIQLVDLPGEMANKENEKSQTDALKLLNACDAYVLFVPYWAFLPFNWVKLPKVHVARAERWNKQLNIIENAEAEKMNTEEKDKAKEKSVYESCRTEIINWWNLLEYIPGVEQKPVSIVMGWFSKDLSCFCNPNKNGKAENGSSEENDGSECCCEPLPPKVYHTLKQINLCLEFIDSSSPTQKQNTFQKLWFFYRKAVAIRELDSLCRNYLFQLLANMGETKNSYDATFLKIIEDLSRKDEFFEKLNILACNILYGECWLGKYRSEGEDYHGRFQLSEPRGLELPMIYFYVDAQVGRGIRI